MSHSQRRMEKVLSDQRLNAWSAVNSRMCRRKAPPPTPRECHGRFRCQMHPAVLESQPMMKGRR
ncbi:unnamed protein product [Ectocarpus sp. 13 AM-2016]